MGKAIGKEMCPTPGCDGAGDNLIVYQDGSKHCFACGLDLRSDGTPSDSPDESSPITQEVTEEEINGVVIGDEHQAITKRGLTQESCEKWDYRPGRYNGRPCQIANYWKDGKIVGQKIRYPNKGFQYNDLGEKWTLYGQHLWKEGGKKLVITEGEIDAISVSQLQNHRWPVVSVPHGANSAARSIRENLEWVESFDEVIFMFDMDDPGREAAHECALLLSPGKAKIAILPLKDANAVLLAGRGEQVVNAIWQAKTYRPDGIVSGSETWELVKRIIDTPSIPYPWTHMNDKSFGMRPGEIVMVTAGSGIGKSSMCREIAYYLFQDLKQTVGYIGLEESVAQTVRAFMSLRAGIPLHLKPTALSQDEQRAAWEHVLNHDRIHLYDHWGSVDSDTLLSKLKYMAKGIGCKWLFLDHISIMISGDGDGDERRMIDNAMTKFRSFVEETQVGLFIVSHLRKKVGAGKAFEEGGRISLHDLRGSGALYQLSDMVIGMERDQQDEEHQNITSVRWLKNRFSGMTGISGTLLYNPDTGRLTDGDPTNPFTQTGVEGTNNDY